MDLNQSSHSTTNSTDTDVLTKIPHNFFDPNLKADHSHFSTEQDFMKEIDKFLHVEERKDVLSSTENDLLSYSNFLDPLHNSQIENADQELNLQEERLKRQHYEQLISILQKKILQYQQKLTYYTKRDIEKDHIIQKLRNNEGLDLENDQLKLKISRFEQEITDTIHLLNKFQAKNEVLELKIENLTSNSNEMRDISKKQIQDLEVRLSNTMKNEQDLQKQIDDTKALCKTERENFIKEKHARSVLDREVSDLKSQMQRMKDEKLKISDRAEQDKKNLELKQKKIFNNLMNEFNDKERNLLKELEKQRAALKNYYQAQLETALEEKVVEFQEQLESFQQEIKLEADKRERMLNERVIKQMELIIKKNEEEIDLINRKCAEETDLYKVQLLNATKTIENLESKLNDYQLRRHDIAENLHSIMENQWKQTLEILTCPSKTRNVPFELESNEISESDNNRQFQPEHMIMNNLSRSEENLKSELLRNYIEMLLKQSPKSEKPDENPSCNMRSSNRQSIQRPWK